MKILSIILSLLLRLRVRKLKKVIDKFQEVRAAGGPGGRGITKEELLELIDELLGIFE